MSAKVTGFDFANFDRNFDAAMEKQYMNKSLYPKFVVSKHIVSNYIFSDDTFHIDNANQSISLSAKLLTPHVSPAQSQSLVGFAVPLSVYNYKSNMDRRIKFTTILDDHPFLNYDVNKFYNTLK